MGGSEAGSKENCACKGDQGGWWVKVWHSYRIARQESNFKLYMALKD